MRRAARVAAGALLGLAAASCELAGLPTGVGKAMCPELGGADALSASFSGDLRANGKIRAFVQAAKDMSGASLQIEGEAADACLRMGRDLGMGPQELAARNEAGGRASGACEAVGARIEAILRQGVSVSVRVQPPSCQANAQASARCGGACGTAGDAECEASCRAHANANASCSPALVTVVPAQPSPQAMALAATLQTNLPQLLHAELALGRRLAGDAQVVAQVGSNLPRIVGQAGAHAMACVGAAADAAATASFRIQVSVRASASVTGRVGATGG